MFKSRANPLHNLISEGEKNFLANQNNSAGQNNSSSSEFFQLELNIEKVSLDAISTLQQTNVEISPYLMIKINGNYKQRTKAKRNNLNPTFNQMFVLGMENPARDVIQIFVHDKERNGETIGFCTIDGLNQFNYGNVTSLVLDLETPSLAGDVTRSSIFSDGICGSIQVDVKPLNFGATEKEANKLLGQGKKNSNKNVRNDSPDKSNTSSPAMVSNTATTGGGILLNGKEKKKSDHNKPHFDLPSSNSSHHHQDDSEPIGAGGSHVGGGDGIVGGGDDKRKSKWFGNTDLMGTPTSSESGFNFDDHLNSHGAALSSMTHYATMNNTGTNGGNTNFGGVTGVGGGEDHFPISNGPTLIQIEGEKEFAKTKQQFKLLYVMAMDIQMFGEKVNKLEELLAKWEHFENDTEKMRSSIQSVILKADKKRELLDRFIPKLSKKLPQVTNCKLTTMKLTKLKTQFETIDKQYQIMLKSRQKIERRHRKKRSERMMEFDELMDHVLYQTNSSVSGATNQHQTSTTSKKSKDKSLAIPSPTATTLSNKNDKVSDRTVRKKIEQDVKKKQFMQAIMAGARDSGATNPDHLARKHEEKQMELQHRKEQAQQQKIQFILSTADAETIELEKKIARETKAELEAVEKDYAELHEMYEQMNFLIREQGQGLNIIEKNIQQANEYVKEGTEYVKAASACTTTGILTGGFTKAAVLKKLIS